MALPNINPIWTKVPKNSQTGSTLSSPVTAAGNDYTGASANNVLLFTADATNGSFVRGIKVKAMGTNVATVARFFLNNGSANTTATNNSIIGEMVLPATTASTTAATSPDYEFPIGYALQPGFRIFVGLTVAVAAGWNFTPIAGDY